MTNYRAFVTLKDGVTKILRIDKAQMAHFVTTFLKVRKFPLISDEWDEYYGTTIQYNEISNVKFKNEYTGEIVLSY